MSTSDPADDRVLATEEQAVALGSAIRIRIVRLCRAADLTNKEIAQRLGRDPATTLHHVRKLVDAGFLEVLPTRRGARGSRERPYRSTTLSWDLQWREGRSRELMDPAMFEAFLTEVAEVGIGSVLQTRLVMHLSEADTADLHTRLHDLLDEFHRRSLPRPVDVRPIAVYLATYPGDEPAQTEPNRSARDASDVPR